MTKRRRKKPFDQKAIRHWTLYVVRLNGSNYYVGITSYKDFMRRIRQHGGRTGAYVNRNKVVEEIIEIHPLGPMPGARAGRIENEMMLEYRRRYGARNVRGGYDVSKKTPLIPTYTPGSSQSIALFLSCLVLALVILFLLTKY